MPTTQSPVEFTSLANNMTTTRRTVHTPRPRPGSRIVTREEMEVALSSFMGAIGAVVLLLIIVSCAIFIAGLRRDNRVEDDETEDKYRDQTGYIDEYGPFEEAYYTGNGYAPNRTARPQTRIMYPSKPWKTAADETLAEEEEAKPKFYPHSRMTNRTESDALFPERSLVSLSPSTEVATAETTQSEEADSRISSAQTDQTIIDERETPVQYRMGPNDYL